MIFVNIKKTLNFIDGLRDLSINFSEDFSRDCLAITGKSGSGKTMLLRMIAGLIHPDGGKIMFRDVVWFDDTKKHIVTPQLRNIGMMFQDYALFPHMTVRENVAYGAKNPEKIEYFMELVKIEKLFHMYPAKLSGGQKQRVALARALANEPQLLLLDEPLTALDTFTRIHLQDELLKIQKLFKIKMILVSHDYNEIEKMANRVITIDQGEIVYDGKPTVKAFPDS